MSYPALADMVIVQHYWWDERTRYGVNASVTFTPKTIGSTGTITPNLTDAAEKAWIKTRPWKVTPDGITGYMAVPLTPNDDPDLTAFGGYEVAPDGETARTVAIPSNASTTTVTTQMRDALAKLSPPIAVTVGQSVKAVWLTDVATISNPPTPPNSFFDATQTTAAIAAGILAHDEDTSAHPDIRALVSSTPDATTSTKGKAKLLGGTADAPTVPYSAVTGAPSSLPPSGGAGGVLGGSYPNPSFAVDMATQAELDAVAAAAAPLNRPIRSVSTNTTAVAGEFLKVDATGAARTVTPPSSPATGAEVIVIKTDNSANAVTWSGQVDGDSQGARLVAQWAAASFVYDGTQWLLRSTNLAAGAASLLTSVTATKTANYTAGAGELVLVDTSGGAFTVTTPASGGPFAVRWKAGTAAPTIAANSGYTISGAASVTMALPPAGSSGELLVYQAFGTDYQSVGGVKPQVALDARAGLLLTQTAKSGAYTAAAWEHVLADVSAASWTLTLPTAPPDKTRVAAKLLRQTTIGPPNTLTVATGSGGYLNTATTTLPAPVVTKPLVPAGTGGSFTGGTSLTTPAGLTATPSTTGGTLAAGTFGYRVSAFNAQGETLASTEATATTSGTTASVGLLWTAVTGAVGYRIYKTTTPGTYTTPVYLIGTLSNSYTDTGAVTVSAGAPAASNTATTPVSVYWVVTAITAAGETVASNEVSAPILPGGTQTLTWQPVSGATGYKVYRGSSAGGESTLVTTTTASTYTYTDTGTTGSAGSPPGSNTATVPGATSGTITLLNHSVTWQYATATATWIVVSDDLPLPQLDQRHRLKLDVAPSSGRGVVCFSYDDCNASMATAANLAAARGQRNTFFITSDQIGNTNKLTTAQLLTMAGQGHELGAHSKTHADMTSIGTAAGRAVEYDTPKTVVEGLIGAGRCNSWAYPLGARNATTDTELYLRYERIFGIGYTAGNHIIPMSDRNGRFLIGRWSWSAANQASVLDLIRLAAKAPVVVVIYCHDPGNVSGAFPNDPTPAQVAEAYDLAASLGVPSVRVDEALPVSNLVVNPGFEEGTTGAVPPGWNVPVAQSNVMVETLPVAPATGMNGSNSLHIGSVNAAFGTVSVEQAIPVLPNMSYKWTFRSQIANLTAGQVNWNMQQLDYAGGVVLDTVGAASANEAWTARTRTLTTASNTMTILLRYQFISGSIGDWYVDHVDMRPTQFGSFG